MTTSQDETSLWPHNRRAVFHALAESRSSVSAQQLHFSLRTNGVDIGLATVYRALHALVASGHAEVVHSANGAQLFCTAAEGQTYRLVCRDCQRRVPVSVTFVHDWAITVANEHGFTDAFLVLEVSGRCGTCSTPQHTGIHPNTTKSAAPLQGTPAQLDGPPTPTSSSA
ncbi:Fur family transcriptional regulator [Saccharopolyspora sp. NPDC003752]